MMIRLTGYRKAMYVVRPSVRVVNPTMKGVNDRVTDRRR